ncbi:MAG: hypothetical protein E4G99_01430 [Anaerolineales bacterium]|nr:MAG: hypothetical protein E4G99_01430 [Anaerolineales bacterium]
MTTRRAIVWTISLFVGVLSTIAIIMIFDTTLARFTLGNAILVFASTGSIVFIWLDYILRTQYLRS